MLPWLPISHIAKFFQACAAFALFASFPALATVTIGNDFSGAFTEVSSTSPLSFAADVTATDLLHGIIPTVTGWNTSNNAHPNELTDGIHGAAFQAVSGDAVQGAWTTVGATATYQLGTGTNGQGYDITSVRSIADWASAAFGNQAWKMEVKPVGGSYVILATVDYQPLGSGAGATKVNLSGLNASGIESIRITANSVNGGANSGAFVWRELDVFGSPTNDATAPTISSLSPADGATGVLPSANLVATFSENISLGTGAIILRNLDTATDLVMNLPDAQVSLSGNLLTINPASNLAAGTNYAVRIGAAAVEDMSGLTFAGLADDTTWNFTTGAPDVTPPAIVTLSPADGTTNVPPASNLTTTFNENIALGSGSITIKHLGTASETVITLPDARVSVAGVVLTINPSANLTAAASHVVRISPGAITDMSGNPFPGISDDTTWNFVTATTPLRIVCMGDSITTGYTDNPGWVNHPFEFGYRSGLHTLLTNAGYNFLFVGGSTEPWTGISGDPTRGGTYKPAFDLRDIGQDGHRGYGGKAVSFLNTNILAWLAIDNPDVILLKIGTNSQDQTGLDTLVGTITTTKPDCHLIIAEIMPKYGYQAGIVNYNTYIRNTLVPKYQALGKKVTLVNQYAPFLTNPADLTTIDTSLFSNGINHPDNDGYDKMAQVWFDGIKALGILNTPPNFSGYSISTPYETAATISLSKLLARVSDTEGDTFSVTTAGPFSDHGGLAVLQVGSVLYTPPPGFSGTDSFPVMITDARGASVFGTVTVTVGADLNSGGLGDNPPQLTMLAGGDVGIAFQGIPGRSYEIQRSTNLSNWITIATSMAAANGAVNYTDEDPPPGSAYYRLRKP